MPLLATGEFAQAATHLNDIGDKATTMRLTIGEVDVHYLFSELALQQRDEPALRRHASRMEELAEHHDHNLYRAAAHRAMGVVYRLSEDFVTSAIRLQQALELFQGIGARWQLGRTFFELAELSVATDEVHKALIFYGRASDLFEELGAVPQIALTRDAIDRCRLVENQATKAPSASADLT